MDIRYDLITCFVVRPHSESYEFLQLLRQPTAFMGATWQSVAGRIESGETPQQTALRELQEETSLEPIEFYALDRPNIFYLASQNALLHSFQFCAVVAPDAEPQLNHEHTDHRWISDLEIEAHTMWQGELDSIAEIRRVIFSNGLAKQYLRLPIA